MKVPGAGKAELYIQEKMEGDQRDFHDFDGPGCPGNA